MRSTSSARVTLRELAWHLALSPTTVSRALNGYPEVGKATRERVQAAAEQLGYVPDRSARRLAHGRADAFGLIFPAGAEQLLDPVFAEFIGGLMDYAARARLEISLQPVPPEDELAAYRRAAAQQGVDGFIVSSARDGADPRVAQLVDMGVPFVVHGRTEAPQPVPFMDIDNYGAFERAGRLLAAYGHRRIALLGGDLGRRFARDRYDGLRAGLGSQDIGADALSVHEGPMIEETGYRAARRAFDLPAGQRPTAFACTSIFVALGVKRAAQERGLGTPEDYTLLAHDDRAPYLRSEFFTPPLTATQASIREGGRRAAEMLHQRVDGAPVENLQETWPVDLVLRNTIGPPPLAATGASVPV